jgi:ABC-type histidine transport system ATPase subunit
MKFRGVSSHNYLHKGVIEEEGSPEQVFGHPKSARCKQFVAGIH